MRAVAVTVRWLMPLLLVAGLLCDVTDLARPMPSESGRLVAAADPTATPTAPHAGDDIAAAVADLACAETPAAAPTDDMASSTPAHLAGFVPIATGSSPTARGVDRPPAPSCAPPYGLVQAGLTVLRL